MVLRYGQLITLTAKDETSADLGYLDDVLAYARFSLMETAIIATNLSDKTKKFFIDMRRLGDPIGKTTGKNAIIITKDLLDPS